MTAPDAPEEPQAPEELETPAGPADRTGHPQVDAALDRLEEAAALPPGEQIAEYDAVHRTLQETLATIDEGRT